VQIALTAASGESKSATGRIEPGARGTAIAVPVGTQAGPWEAAVRIRGEVEPAQFDSVTIARDSGRLLGPPLAFRAAAAAVAPFRPLAAFHFRRTERLRVEWPVRSPIDSHQARLLDRKAQPLQVPVALSTKDSGASTVLVADLNLAPLNIGEYLIEVTAKSGETIDRKVLAIRVSHAR